jgi:hypothetical protein
MAELYKIFVIGGLIYLGLGGILEFIYFIYLKDLVWILLIYPPPGIMGWVEVTPYLGIFFLMLGWSSFVIGITLYLKLDIGHL